MPLVRTFLMATAACLIGAAAHAQTASDNTAAPDAMPQAPATQPSPDAAPAQAPMTQAPMTQAPMAQSPMAMAQNEPASGVVVTPGADGVQVIASQPVPDTAANRAKFGKPMSNAGRRTAPAGN